MPGPFVSPIRCRRASLAGLVLLASAAAPVALAQYTGPGARQAEPLPVLRSVVDVIAKGQDDQRVELTGRLVEQTGRETYAFRDETGQLEVEIDDDDLPAGTPIDDQVVVTLIGEIEVRLARPQRVDVDKVKVEKPAQAGRQNR